MFCLPVPKDKYQTATPWVLIAIALIDAVLLVPLFGAGKAEFITHYAFFPGHPTFLTLVSAIFLHAGLWHYIGNMWFLWIFGRKVECLLGHIRFAVLYLLSGIGGQLLHLLLNLHSMIPLVGASGAISGIAGIYFVLFQEDRFHLHLYLGYWKVKTFDTTTRGAVGAWIGEQTILGLLTRLSLFTSVAFWAHVGGFLVGATGGVVFDKLVSTEGRPTIPLIATFEDIDNQEQPSELTTLKLS
jgi:membrane associated rhomboid family serine protease